jgi:hypothetical protein
VAERPEPDAPLVAGSIYGLRLGKGSGDTDYGEASETGLGTWVTVTSVPNTNLRAAAATLKLTGYYRPEDFEIDPIALADSKVRFCANNTGNESQDNNYWVINEDGDGPEVGRNNDIWSCLEDGDDADDQSDGCTRVATLNDLTAESTGGVFDRYGNHYYVSIQHNITGHGVVLDITGWR